MVINMDEKPLNGTVRLPGSKSISNRLLIIREFSRKPFVIDNLSDSGDTRVMQALLSKIHRYQLHVVRSSKVSPDQHPGDFLLVLNTGDAGAVMRFLTAFLACTPGRFLLTGSERMKRRPVEGLVTALKSLGAFIQYRAMEGYPPLEVKGQILTGGRVTIDASVSSQFITALLMMAPSLKKGLHLDISGLTVSQPYIDMTIRLMDFFGIRVRQDENSIDVDCQAYHPKDITVEADWSSAAFWYEALAMAVAGQIELKDLDINSMQGDRVLAKLFEKLGVVTRFTGSGASLIKTGQVTEYFEFDFTDHPDIVPAVAVTCAALNIPSRLTGLKTLEIKESQRLSALCREMKKMNIDVIIENGHAMTILKSEAHFPKDKVIKTYNDHRLVMAFALLALKHDAIKVDHPESVNKSYPLFWKHLEDKGFHLSPIF
jgi:3-phosphoshikimate 1-carboxyvinyltransferase